MPTDIKLRPWTIVARSGPDRDRIDWKAERDRIDLAAVATRLLGPAPGRRGERGRRLWWRCPFHDDKNPSLMVDPGKPWWKCWGCGEHGDAATLVMKLQGVGFPEARDILTGRRQAPWTGTTARKPAPDRADPRPTVQPEAPTTRGMGPEAAAALTDDAARRLWAPEGADALAYLTARGLTPETIRAARLGWLPEGNPAVPWKAPGIAIPWRDKGRVVLVKIRPDAAWRETIPPDRRQPPKYLEAFRAAPPELYPDPETVRPGRPLVIVEGELDALLLGQELGELASVATLGSASMVLNGAILARLLTAPVWWIATDADEAGDKAAAAWLAFPRAKRSRPPAKDWGELHEGGPNRIRYYWMPVLGWKPPAWEELQAQRWGPGLDDPTEGIDHDRPARTTEEIQAILDAIQDDPEYRDEREAIRLEGTKDDTCERQAFIATVAGTGPRPRASSKS